MNDMAVQAQLSPRLRARRENIPFGMAFVAVMHDEHLSLGAKMLHAYLWSRHFSEKSEIFPAQETIAFDMRCGRSSIIRWSEEIQKRGLVTIERRNTRHGIQLFYVLEDLPTIYGDVAFLSWGQIDKQRHSESVSARNYLNVPNRNIYPEDGLNVPERNNALFQPETMHCSNVKQCIVPNWNMNKTNEPEEGETEEEGGTASAFSTPPHLPLLAGELNSDPAKGNTQEVRTPSTPFEMVLDLELSPPETSVDSSSVKFPLESESIQTPTMASNLMGAFARQRDPIAEARGWAVVATKEAKESAKKARQEEKVKAKAERVKELLESKASPPPGLMGMDREEWLKQPSRLYEVFRQAMVDAGHDASPVMTPDVGGMLRNYATQFETAEQAKDVLTWTVKNWATVTSQQTWIKNPLPTLNLIVSNSLLPILRNLAKKTKTDFSFVMATGKRKGV